MSGGHHLGRVGVIGDIHAEDGHLQTALEYLAGLDLDLTMAVGDVADGRGSVDRCCRLLRQYRVSAVAGNHDRWLLAGEARDLPGATSPAEVSSEARAYLSALPRTLEYETAAGPLLLCHGLGADDMGGVKPGDYGYALASNFALQRLRRDGKYRFVVNGHTHRRVVRSFEGLTVINAGTLFGGHRPCFLVADFECGFVQYYDLAGGGASQRGRVDRVVGRRMTGGLTTARTLH